MRAKQESALVRELLEWWSQNQRIFPWRNARNPYHILVAEVLLHRTRANQASRAYEKFLERYPTIEVLAAADSGELLDLLKPLGLSWRAALLRSMAEMIVRDHGGLIPEAAEELKSLPGLGDYIASAVSTHDIALLGVSYKETIIETVAASFITVVALLLDAIESLKKN